MRHFLYFGLRSHSHTASLLRKVEHRERHAIAGIQVEHALVLVACLLEATRVKQSHCGRRYPAAFDIAVIDP